MSNFAELMELADRCDKLMEKVDESFAKMSRGGIINTSVGTTGMINNLKTANSLFKKIDNITSIYCSNCRKKVGQMPDGNWQHRVLPYQGKTDEELEAYKNLIASIDWRYCDNPPQDRMAVPNIVPETNYSKEEKAAIEARAKELTAKYNRYLMLIEQANEIAKGFLKMPAEAVTEMAKGAAEKLKGKKEEPEGE